MAERQDIQLKVPINEANFFDNLFIKENLKQSDDEEYRNVCNTQSQVCTKIFNKCLSVISGAAGTGKTTIIKSLIAQIQRMPDGNSSFLLLAPTGKASERIKTQLGDLSDRVNVKTIHSYLASNGWLNSNLTFKEKGGSIGESASTIIIDECSMIDLTLFATLLKAINFNSVKRLMLIGDPNQLPPIGRGKVFADIIDWLKTNYPRNFGMLIENIRQLENKVVGSGNGILELANIFINDKQSGEDTADFSAEKENILSRLQSEGKVDEDLAVYYWQDQKELFFKIKKVLKDDLQKAVKSKEEDINALWRTATNNNAVYQQFISPYKAEFSGVENLNKQLQDIINEGWAKRFTIDNITLFDKVIQVRNRTKSNPIYAYNYETNKNEKCEIFNGEIGFANPHGFDKQKIGWLRKIEHFGVAFSGKNRDKLAYNYGTNLGKGEKYPISAEPVGENLQLAYAISVHKSQGSEFDRVYLVLPAKESHLLNMELFYTAITRASKHLTIFIEKDIETIANLTRLERASTRRINSSVFQFNPLPNFMLSNTWFLDAKKISTLNSKYLVRSKSEENIANMLVLSKIKFEYEKPLFAPDGTMFLPDFTINWQGENYYWEHVGMLDVPKYKKHWEKKKEWYKKHFYGKLIETYEGNDRSEQNRAAIKKYFGIEI